MDAESSREGVESEERVRTTWQATRELSQALKRQTELGTPPWCQRPSARPHGNGRVLDAESGWEGVEYENRVRAAET